ncbi:response regulator [Naumannella halotolerans]|uniref:DNA-binding NarL/FixJ family response regulator n=1 Tax=Naumannella halotolerans TaxID=993414 RepID=A0A4R7J274_9ACTN|nr:response regulator transcription factor [Naumannella halotolerans]TDT31282.1 DNA-binding NarL/FixJ family response regulator [Naumannella halotolerans]
MDGDQAMNGHEGEAAPAEGVCRVGIVDDNAVVRMGIRSLLTTDPSITVVGEAANGHDAVQLVRREHPDVLLLDVRMPRQDGVSVAVELSGETSIVMLTYSEAPDVIGAAVRAGAKGYLVHGHFDENELISAVRLAHRGMGTFSPQAITALASPRRSRDGLIAQYHLSEREAEIIELISTGADNTTIAGSLFIAEKTVKNHINRLFAKLGVRNRGEAISLWLGDA